MAVNRDFRDLFRIFNECGVEYLVVGAYAVIYYSAPRYTKDLDIWVNPTPDNSRRVWKALEEFGAPLTDIRPEDFTDREIVYQIGIEPNRIDLMTGIPGLTFSEAWSVRRASSYGGISISILGRDHLLRSKLAAGRPRDLLDAEKLDPGSAAGGGEKT
jgi:hypothetical protein